MNATAAPAIADRAMPSVNQKRGSSKGFIAIVIGVVAAIAIGAGAVWIVVNKVKSKDTASPKQAQEEPVPVKTRKIGDVNAMPAPGAFAGDEPDPAPEAKVPPIGINSPAAPKTAPTALRQPGTAPRPTQGAESAAVPEIRAIPPRAEAPAGPSPYDSGFVVTGATIKGNSPIPGLPAPGAAVGGMLGTPMGGDSSGSGAGKGALQGLLTSTNTPMIRAGRISNRSLMASEGTTAECVLRTRIVVAQPGMVVCRLSTPIYSANSKVVLADRGSNVTGELTGTLKQGQTRIFVLWRRIETPEGVTIRIDAPAADQLGTPGVDGDLDNRWPERVGAALMLSVVSDAIAYQTAKDASGSATGSVAYQGVAQTGKSIAEKVLESTINIPPTLTRNQGDKILIMIPRDLDFSSVYDLETK